MLAVSPQGRAALRHADHVIGDPVQRALGQDHVGAGQVGPFVEGQPLYGGFEARGGQAHDLAAHHAEVQGQPAQFVQQRRDDRGIGGDDLDRAHVLSVPRAGPALQHGHRAVVVPEQPHAEGDHRALLVRPDGEVLVVDLADRHAGAAEQRSRDEVAEGVVVAPVPTADADDPRLRVPVGQRGQGDVDVHEAVPGHLLAGHGKFGRVRAQVFAQDGGQGGAAVRRRQLLNHVEQLAQSLQQPGRGVGTRGVGTRGVGTRGVGTDGPRYGVAAGHDAAS